jgi:sialidase-1
MSRLKGLLVWLLALVVVGFGTKGSTLFAEGALDAFLGDPAFSMQKMFDGRGGRSLVTTMDGTVLAINGKDYRKSHDGGLTWTDSLEVGADAGGTNAIVNEMTGDLLLVHPQGYQWRSLDHGETWCREETTILPDEFGLGSPGGVPLIVWASQSGITLRHGNRPGRLLMPARLLGPKNSNDEHWRPYHYNTALFSDDNGTTWQVSAPFPVLGTGESALAEMSSGQIYYSSREHMTRGNRFIAWSDDAGQTWINAYRCSWLPDGPRASSYGCMGGVIRLPILGRDIVIYSNLDTDLGQMPAVVGGTIENDRQRITVWASFDGAKTWPVKRLVFDGPSAYSNLGVGRPGTASEGKIFLMFEGGPQGMYEGVQLAMFNLSWLLDGQDIAAFIEDSPYINTSE